MNVHSRHSLLVRSIGAFDPETSAYGLTLGLAIGFPIGLVVITVVKHVIYLLYNNSFHPFYNLVKDYKKSIKMNSKACFKSYITEQPEEIPLQEVGNGHQEAEVQLEEIPLQNVQIEQEDADDPIE